MGVIVSGKAPGSVGQLSFDPVWWIDEQIVIIEAFDNY